MQPSETLGLPARQRTTGHKKTEQKLRRKGADSKKVQIRKSADARRYRYKKVQI